MKIKSRQRKKSHKQETRDSRTQRREKSDHPSGRTRNKKVENV